MAKEKLQRPLVKCPYCDYTCHGTQALGRHVYYKHPEKSGREEITIKREFLQGMLQTMEELVERERSGQNTDEIQKEIREQDIRLRLKLVAVALAKAQRVVDNQLLLSKLDCELAKHINDDEMRSKLTPDAVVGLRKILNEDMQVDVAFVQSILTMKEDNDASFFTRLVRMMEMSGAKTKSLLVGKENAFGLIEFDNERDRSNVRKIVKGLLARSKGDIVPKVKELNGSGGTSPD